MVKSEIVIPKVWRSELKSLALYFVFCVLSVVLSRTFPASVREGELISVGSVRVVLALPLWWFLPFLTLGAAMIKIYNVRFTVDHWGAHAKVGILSLRTRSVSVRYEDIRSIECDQSLLERIVNVGAVLVSTAAGATDEVVFEGVAAPHEIQDMLQRERDGRQKAAKAAGVMNSEAAANAAGFLGE
jgi:uncharacterized membrane protein YdbT with pleckstrin-like domain